MPKYEAEQAPGGRWFLVDHQRQEYCEVMRGMEVTGVVTYKQESALPRGAGVRRGEMSVEKTVKTKQRVLWTINPRKATGEPAELEEAAEFVVWSGGGSVEAVDKKHAWLWSGEQLGFTTFMVTFRTDLGEGEVEVQDWAILKVEHPRAWQVRSHLGEAEDAPERLADSRV